ncbi:uncharacterized protein LOC121992466 [Zingiber officinale]|uniref:uncharacterized protein LOC121992466 n=1 Tax=Zingiber officinale TaxID=94328 RepID=UPI001C4C819E|nr:uncharacterized protein LOC121992466 [Zingiber officinale]
MEEHGDHLPEGTKLKEYVPKTLKHPVNYDYKERSLTKEAVNAQHDNGQKHLVKGSNSWSTDRGSSSEDASRKTRKKHHNQSYETPMEDVVVPPFADWEKNPESAENYTDVFQIIGDSRKTPGTPIKYSFEKNTKPENTEPKGCFGRCFSWILK